jgi:hypothetical protein
LMPKTRRTSPVHPVLKQILGTMLLANDMGEMTRIMVTKKAFEWISGGKGRSFHVTNIGNDVEITFTVNGKTVDAPF